MKEYQYSIIRRVSRNPKRNREGRGISQSDLEALKQELEGNSQGIVSAIYDRDIALDSLAVTSGDISERLKTAEEALTGKLDSGDFSTWRTGELADALASKQPKGSYVDPSQLATSQQQAVDEAVKRAEELDKQIKVGGRNLITKATLWKATTDDGYGWVLESDKPDSIWLSESRDYPQAKAGDTVTLSLLIRCDKSEWGASEWAIRVADSQGSLTYFNPNKEVFGEFYKHSWTFNLREGGRLPFIQLYAHLWRKDENGRTRFNKRIEAKYIKLERGTVATDWTPAPEDLDNSIYKLTSQLDIHDKTLGSQAEAIEVMAGSVEMLSEQYSIEAHTIGSPILKSDTDQYDIQCRIIHTPTGTDYTDQLLLSAQLIKPEWYRINPEGHDRTGYTDIEWRDKHRGDAEVVITRKDFVTSCTVGYKIPREQIVKAIKSLEH